MSLQTGLVGRSKSLGSVHTSPFVTEPWLTDEVCAPIFAALGSFESLGSVSVCAGSLHVSCSQWGAGTRKLEDFRGQKW